MTVSTDAAGPEVLNEAATATNPTVVPNKADPDTGIAWSAANTGALVAGGVTALTWDNESIILPAYTNTVLGTNTGAEGSIAYDSTNNKMVVYVADGTFETVTST